MKHIRDLWIIKSAVVSPCGRYRYELRREWDANAAPLVFIMLNPSTADSHDDDPTITRCIRRALDQGCGSLIVVNLFAGRATRPADLRRMKDPIGPDNDSWIAKAMQDSHGVMILCGWGSNVRANEDDDRISTVQRLARTEEVDLYCLGETKSGQPKHPLYVPYSTTPYVWRPF